VGHRFGDSLTIIMKVDPILPMVIISGQVLDLVIIARIMVVALEAVIIIIDDDHELDFTIFKRHFLYSLLLLFKDGGASQRKSPLSQFPNKSVYISTQNHSV
jgi:hypothetical protein